MSIRDIIEAIRLLVAVLSLVYLVTLAAALGWRHGRGGVKAVEIHLHGSDWKRKERGL